MVEEGKKAKLTRRDFVKKTAFGVAVVSGASLLGGCTTETATDVVVQEPTTAVTEAAAPTTAPTTAPVVEPTAVEPQQPVGHSWEIKPEPIAAADISETIAADVVVVGAGISGMMATFSAAEAGAKVVLIEKSETFNARSSHNAALNSKLQQASGLKYDRAQIVNTLIKSYGNKADASLIWLWANHVDEYMDMILDMTKEAGIEVAMFGNDVPNEFYPEYKTVHIIPETDLTALLETKAKELGAEVYYSTPGEQLIRGEDGRVTGVIAKKADGTYVQFDAAKGVILATGDYGHNQEMIDAWCPIANQVDFNVYSPEVNTGDGIKMALWVGGAMQDEAPHAPMVHNLGAAPFSGNPFLRINAAGKRYENEEVPIDLMANSIQRQPGHRTYTIYDSTYAEDLPNTIPSFSKAVAVSERTTTSIQSALDAGTSLFSADTLEELAGKINVPADAFVATVARYNELVEKGVDEDFGKNPKVLTAIDTPPYYAAYNSLALLVVMGGLKCNDSLQVIDTEGNPIPGLYASGNAVGAFCAGQYPVTVPGMSHSRAWTFGRIAGQNAAKG